MTLLTPRDIDSATFDVRHVRGGYDTKQVDALLRDAALTVTMLADRIRELEAEHEHA